MSHIDALQGGRDRAHAGWNSFASNMDPLAFEILEQTTDLCEDVADVVQNVAVKNS
jgi:hypothetical protein